MKTSRLKRFFQDFYLVFVLIFLYAPILTMMVLSFNTSKSTVWLPQLVRNVQTQVMPSAP